MAYTSRKNYRYRPFLFPPWEQSIPRLGTFCSQAGNICCITRGKNLCPIRAGYCSISVGYCLISVGYSTIIASFWIKGMRVTEKIRTFAAEKKRRKHA